MQTLKRALKGLPAAAKRAMASGQASSRVFQAEIAEHRDPVLNPIATLGSKLGNTHWIMAALLAAMVLIPAVAFVGVLHAMNGEALRVAARAGGEQLGWGFVTAAV